MKRILLMFFGLCVGVWAVLFVAYYVLFTVLWPRIAAFLTSNGVKGL